MIDHWEIESFPGGCWFLWQSCCHKHHHHQLHHHIIIMPTDTMGGHSCMAVWKAASTFQEAYQDFSSQVHDLLLSLRTTDTVNDNVSNTTRSTTDAANETLKENESTPLPPPPLIRSLHSSSTTATCDNDLCGWSRKYGSHVHCSRNLKHYIPILWYCQSTCSQSRKSDITWSRWRTHPCGWLAQMWHYLDRIFFS